MSYVSRISRKIGDMANPLLAKGRRKKLTRTDFSIFSNNCWAGSVYRRYGLPYSSPTAGLYFFASDYVKFASRLRHYTATPLEFIDARDSRYADQLREKGELDKPVARLDDIEVVFLHYPSPEEAAEDAVIDADLDAEAKAEEEDADTIPEEDDETVAEAAVESESDVEDAEESNS